MADYLATYAAILSTLVAIWNYAQARPRIKVNVVAGMDTSNPASRMGAYVYVRNLSSHDVPLSAITLLFRYGSTSFAKRAKHLIKYRQLPRTVGWAQASLSNYAVDDGCPTVVAARSSHRIFIPEAVLERIAAQSGKRVLMCSVHDQLWNRIFSNHYSWNAPPPS